MNAAVVLPVPVSRAYIYEVPPELADRVIPGARVVVPLRRRNVVGIVTDVVGPQSSVGIALKAIKAAPDAEPALSPALLDLGRWLSDYYGAPLGLSLRALLPGPLWSVARPAGPAPAAERLFVLTGNGVDSLLERERRFKRSPKRRAAYETVEALGGSAPVSPTASAPMPGGRCAAASGASRSGRARPSSRPCSGSARSWWTRSTSRATSRPPRRAITRAMPPRCALSSRELV